MIPSTAESRRVSVLSRAGQWMSRAQGRLFSVRVQREMRAVKERKKLAHVLAIHVLFLLASALKNRSKKSHAMCTSDRKPRGSACRREDGAVVTFPLTYVPALSSPRTAGQHLCRILIIKLRRVPLTLEEHRHDCRSCRQRTRHRQ